MSFHDNPLLQNDVVRLEPLTMEHADGLRDAVRDGELWKAWYTFPPRPEKVEADIERRLSLQSKETMAPWTIVDSASGRIVGQTTFMNINALNRRVEIGSTWLAASTHGTRINPATKLLLLTRAFEELDCIAVEFRTHWHNRQSRAGIEKLGAKLDGVLRNHEIMTGGQMRDTVVYSILPGEWPTVKLGLEHRLQG
ncbi:GNAT family protein [uncultured Agrococcus sp.]|uniref:GNAT family N-acetyltransferase n=1 Tax=uncultured Agrococcus sp. TaxID=382258 RepID=UPI0025D83E87|nr:GNAT family protein [uncultured Agrococcus sp.]